MSSAPPSPTPTLLRPPSFHPAAVEWTPGTQPRYVIINPMHIISLQDRTKTFAVRVVEKIKTFSERWFSHILLLFFLLIYASLGALLFQYLELELEQGEKKSIIRSRELVIDTLWKEAAKPYQTSGEWSKFAERALKAYEDQVHQLLLSNAPADSEKTVWTFWGSLFYAGTVFTTIGYGNIVPATDKGKAATIVYAFIGIPFLLMVLADLGRLFTRAIKALFFYAKLFYHTGKLRKARKIGRRATSVPVQYMTVAWNKMPYLIYQNRNKRGSVDVTQPQNVDLEAGNNNEVLKESDEKNPANAKELENDIKDKKTEKAEPADKNETENEIVPPALEDDVDDEFNLPVTLAIILLLGYMMLGAFIFTLWEEWTFFDSFYFVFISMSTIGFGDFVPDHPIYMMATFIYLLFGLALTSMCINVIQEKLSATFEMAKLRIGATIGLDANMLMDEEMYAEKSDSPERKNDSVKARRGSKAVVNKTPEGKKKKEETDIALQNKTNGIDEKGFTKLTETGIRNHN